MDKNTETLFIEIGKELKKQQQVIIKMQERLTRAEGLINSYHNRIATLETR